MEAIQKKGKQLVGVLLLVARELGGKPSYHRLQREKEREREREFCSKNCVPGLKWYGNETLNCRGEQVLHFPLHMSSNRPPYVSAT